VCREESCEDGLFAPAAFCDGLGDCALVDEIACGAYRCAGTRCGESCSADADCTPGNRCEENRCFAGATCSDDGLALIDEDSLRVDCAPYRCSGGMCLLGCDTTAACAPGFSCNPGNQRCEATATQAAEDDAGCACRAVSAPRHSGGPRLSLLATLFLFGIVCMRRATLQR
jgi:hypothetical protein